jgi:DNA helicase II / ATP-dependent DNA helicase PcrA
MLTKGDRMKATTDPFILETLWSDAGFAPNSSQEAAIRHVNGPLYLPAGPGSGKTRVLLWRTVNLIVFEGVEPERIFLSTFTEKAARQLRDGLVALLGLASQHSGKYYDLGRMYVGTVHSSCQKLLADRKLIPAGLRERAPLLLDDLDQYLFVSRRGAWTKLCQVAELNPTDAPLLINQFLGGSGSRSKHSAVEAVIALFNRLSEECIDPEDAAARSSDPIVRQLLKMYSGYLKELRPDGAVPQTDFALMQRDALRLLTNNPTAGQRFNHVIVDEYQDTNAIQERLFFELAKSSGNLCVVGDDDQALYRFRGATVENFVRFPERCVERIGTRPTEIPLIKNYRSRPEIVAASSSWLAQFDWRRENGGSYRVEEKVITANRLPAPAAVGRPHQTKPLDSCDDLARFIAELVATKAVSDPNQIAFLYPSLKSPHVERMTEALEAHGLRTYAPRAHPFLETDEATLMLGLFALILGAPRAEHDFGGDWRDFNHWLSAATTIAADLARTQPTLRKFVADRQLELSNAATDFNRLVDIAESRNWHMSMPFDVASMRRIMAEASGLSTAAVRNLVSRRLTYAIEQRAQTEKPHTVLYVIQRATAIDWSLLDLFYRLTAFQPFVNMFAAAERDTDPDEGPIANLGLLTQYLSRFIDRRAAIISGEGLSSGVFQRLFFFGFLYALYKRGESEFENAEDPFPKGRIPFITIHQSKGLEFPVVVLGNLRKDDKGPPTLEGIVRPLVSSRDAEPLSKLSRFDIARMYYVALTRAKDLLILQPFSGPGQRTNAEYKPILDSSTPLSPSSKGCIESEASHASEVPSTYSYTGDFLAYKRCPRQYAIFREFGFVPSRSQTMLFGTLVHRTLEDLHDHLIRQRAQSA